MGETVHPRMAWGCGVGNLQRVCLPLLHIALPVPQWHQLSHDLTSRVWHVAVLKFPLASCYISTFALGIPITASDTLNWENTEEILIMSQSSSCTTGCTEGCDRTLRHGCSHCALALSSISSAAGTAGWGSNHSCIGKKMFSRASQSVMSLELPTSL